MKDPKPFTSEMHATLLVNALRALTEEQRSGLCLDIYARSSQKEYIDRKIAEIKSEQ